MSADRDLRQELLALHRTTGDRAFLAAARKLTPAEPPDLLTFLQEQRAARRGPKAKATPRVLDARLLRMAAEVDRDPHLRVARAARREVARHGHLPFASPPTAVTTLAREFGREGALWLAALRQLREVETTAASLTALAMVETAATASLKTMVGEAARIAAADPRRLLAAPIDQGGGRCRPCKMHARTKAGALIYFG